MTLDVSIVTGTRADWSLLRPLARALRDHPGFRLSIVATGSHLVERFGRTVDDVRRDGFEVTHELPILDEVDDRAATTRAVARAVSGFSETLAAAPPDLVIVLGDRYEILGIVEAAVLMGVPVAHLCGGDVTEGAFDDSLRHAISKLAHLHFPSNEEAARRLLAMGEAPERIVTAGSTGLDNLHQTPTLSRQETFEALGLEVSDTLILVTFHPPTLSDVPAEDQFAELAAALDALPEDVAVVLTGSNADPAGRRLTDLAETYARGRPRTVFRVSLGGLYPSVMRQARAVVGNSSSGLYEAPSFGIATVDIGDRQKGRLKASSVIGAPPRRDAVSSAIREALAGDFRDTVNPYGDGHAVERIVARLETIDDPRSLLVKTFHMVGTS